MLLFILYFLSKTRSFKGDDLYPDFHGKCVKFLIYELVETKYINNLLETSWETLR